MFVLLAALTAAAAAAVSVSPLAEVPPLDSLARQCCRLEALAHHLLDLRAAFWTRRGQVCGVGWVSRVSGASGASGASGVISPDIRVRRTEAALQTHGAGQISAAPLLLPVRPQTGAMAPGGPSPPDLVQHAL